MICCSLNTISKGFTMLCTLRRTFYLRVLKTCEQTKTRPVSNPFYVEVGRFMYPWERAANFASLDVVPVSPGLWFHLFQCPEVCSLLWEWIFQNCFPNLLFHLPVCLCTAIKASWPFCHVLLSYPQ